MYKKHIPFEGDTFFNSDTKRAEYYKLHLPSDLLTGVDDKHWLEISTKTPMIPLEILLNTTSSDAIDYLQVEEA